MIGPEQAESTPQQNQKPNTNHQHKPESFQGLGLGRWGLVSVVVGPPPRFPLFVCQRRCNRSRSSQ